MLLILTVVGLMLVLLLPGLVHAEPVLRLEASCQAAELAFFGLDTEGTGRETQNLLRTDSAVTLHSDGAPVELVTATSRQNSASYRVRTQSGAELLWRLAWSKGQLECSFETRGQAPVPISLTFPFDARVTATTLLASDWTKAGSTITPALLSVPDFGQLLITAKDNPLHLRLSGNYSRREVDVLIETTCVPGKPVKITLSPYCLTVPERVDSAMWKLARRGWFGALEALADNGADAWNLPTGQALVRELHPPGMLGNEVISGNATCSTWFYADQVLWIPEVAPGVSVAQMLRRTLDITLDTRLEPSGRLICYWMPTHIGAYADFLDSQPSVLISAWDYVEATGDVAWLRQRIDELELVASYLAARDVNGDGLVEAVQSGNDGTLVDPARGASWWDAVDTGWQDGYTNALTFRAWCCLAELEERLGRQAQAESFRRLARLLKQAYAPALWAEENGWLGWWRSQDGVLHDPAAILVNSLAIEYGLLDKATGKAVLARFHRELERAGYTRLDLGVPASLRPFRPEEYLLGITPGICGVPGQADGSDTLGQYQNGGVHAGHTLHWLAAHYVAGETEYADSVLQQMLERQAKGLFQNGVWGESGKGIEWTNWQGQPTGADGYLADNFRFLQALFLRDPELRKGYYRPIERLREGQPG